MLYVMVLYPNQSGSKFDFDYYMKKHIPMVESLLNTSIAVSKGIATPNGTPIAFVCTARMRINSLEEFSTAFAKHGAQITGDIPNYTDIQPSVQIDEVLA